MKKEINKKIEDETYSSSPPYSYNPSLAEYFSTADVTKNSFIAEILYLDNKKKIKIIDIRGSIITLKILDYKDLEVSEEYIINYLKMQDQNIIKLDTAKIPKKIIKKFSALVKISESKKFNSGFMQYLKIDKEVIDSYNPNLLVKNNSIENLPRTFFIYQILTGLVFNFIPFLGLIALLVGLNKLKKQNQDMGFFFKKFILRYIGANCVYISGIIILALLSTLIKRYIPHLGEISLLLIPLTVVIWFLFFLMYSKIILKYSKIIPIY
jgi:hypothetical protein